jgi:light-regulated signal transduction histidine kinase (bacteriophytochrome)
MGSFVGKDFGLPLVDGESTEIDIFRPGKDSGVGDMHVVEAEWLNEKAHVITIRDITERKQAEEALKKTMADLERSNKELEQFAYVASHDLQEPLRMVASYVQLLAKRYQDKLDADANEFIGYAVDGANRMQEMINDLLSYSRIETRGKPFETVDCTAILNQALTNLKIAIEESSAVITHNPLPTMTGDESQLIQLFQNLIGNAVKFRGKETPHIHISCKSIEEWEVQNRGLKSEIRNLKSKIEKGWVFSVRDNGIGIDPQHKERVFNVFQRLHGRDYSGTGIGLSICKRVVERYGGKIWVESEPEKGSTFYFTIPDRHS